MTTKLSDQLRALPDDGLGALLRLRPDLTVPVPADISALASRAQGRASVARALDTLDQFTLEMLDGLRLVRDADRTASLTALLTLAAEAGVSSAEVRAAVDRLRARFLVYGVGDELRLVGAVDELTSPYPMGLGRSAADLDKQIAELVADSAGLRRVLLSAPPEARAVLDLLAEGPPVGSVAIGTLREHTATRESTGSKPQSKRTPVRWLVEHKLLAVIADDLVELPREIALVLRREHGPLGVLHPQPPRVEPVSRTGVDSAGAGQALEAVRQLDTLLQALARNPAPVLRSFGLGLRELRRLSRETGIAEPVAALLLEIAYAGALVSYTEPAGASMDQHWLPTASYDAWRTGSLPVRWAKLARTWLAMTRAPSMVGQRDEKDRAITALSLESSRLSAPVIRRHALADLAELPQDAALGHDAVLQRLAWRWPRRMGRASASGPAGLARAALVEAAALGVTALDAITSYGRVLLAERSADPDADPLGIRGGEASDALVAALAPLLPVPVEHVLVQADLTVVVPGPPEADLATELAQVADAESRGGATVYRVTPQSVRRAMDAGYTAGDVRQLFAQRSRTELPQTLTYLIDDVARRHGGLRTGNAGAYLRADDEALLAEVLADRRLAPMQLRRLAPTVLITGYATTRLLAALREAGYAPVAEDASGATVVSRPKSPRAPNRAAPRGVPDDFDPPGLTGARLAGVVEQIRAGERLAKAARRAPKPMGRPNLGEGPLNAQAQHMQALSVLQQALREQSRVWVGYVDAHGGAASRLVRPVSLSAGYLRAEDDRTDMLHTFALHRITSAVPEDAQ